MSDEKAVLMDTGIVLPETKRRTISQIKFSDVSLYSITKDGRLFVLPETGKALNLVQLQQTVNAYLAQKDEVVSEKQDDKITLQDVVKILRKKGILD